MGTRNERSRLRARGLAYKATKRKEQTRFLTSLIGDESVLAQNRSAFVSDRRVVEAVRLERRWNERAVPFHEVTGWAPGTEHDGRPFVLLHHAPIVRLGWVPGRRFLWWRWGRGVRMVPWDSIEFSFSRSKDPVYAALVEALEIRALPERPRIERRPEGTRAERTKHSHAMPLLLVDAPRTMTDQVVLDELLTRGASDWLMASDVAWVVRELGGATTDELVTDAALDAIRTLLALGFMRAGDVTDGGFFEWELSFEEGDEPHRARLEGPGAPSRPGRGVLARHRSRRQRPGRTDAPRHVGHAPHGRDVICTPGSQTTV